MDESQIYHLIYIEKLYKDILQKIKGGSIYGIEVEDNDLKLQVVAAYFAGMTEERNIHEKRMLNVSRYF